jgi:hypothetical protein
LAPLTGYADARRQSAAWSFIALARLGKGRPEGAVQAAAEALRADRDDPLARYVMTTVAGHPGSRTSVRGSAQ